MFDADCSLFIYPKCGRTVVVFAKLFMSISPTLLLSLITTDAHKMKIVKKQPMEALKQASDHLPGRKKCM